MINYQLGRSVMSLVSPTSQPLTCIDHYAVTISLPAPSLAVIVLSQLDRRFFEAISGCARWLFDFVVFRRGETKPVATSSYSKLYSRSVNAEVYLEAGDYVVHVCAFPSCGIRH